MNDHEAMLAIQQSWTERNGRRTRSNASPKSTAGWIPHQGPGRPETRADAIPAGARDRKEPTDMPGPGHVPAILREGHVRLQIDAIIETNRDFGNLPPNAVSDEEIRNACLSVAATIDLSNEIGLPNMTSAVAQH
jgi:hypothetical protein